MIENLHEISVDQLLDRTNQMLHEGYRFITSTCVDNNDGFFSVTYHFDKDLNQMNFRIAVKKEDEIPSISKIYFCALLVENEMKELFGLNVTNIVVDFEGHLLLSEGAPDEPMRKNQIIIEKRGK